MPDVVAEMQNRNKAGNKKSATQSMQNREILQTLAGHLSEINKLDAFSDTNQLKVSREWFQTLVNHVSDYVFVKDRRSRFVFGNDKVATDLGYPSIADLIGKSDWDLHTSEDAKLFFDVEQTLMETGRPLIDYEEVMNGENGHERWYETSKIPVLDSDGRVVGLVGVAKDITLRKKIELLQQGQNRVLKEIATGIPLATVLNTLVQTIEEQLEGIIGSVMLVDDDEKTLATAIAPNLPEDYLVAATGAPIGPRAGSCGTAVFTRQNVIVDDIFKSELWTDYLDVMKNFDMRSCWSVPFYSMDNKVLGTFGLYSRTVRSPTEFETRIAEEAARLASIAVERDIADKRIRYLAHHDPLTGLPNRQEFKSKLERKIANSRKTGEPVAVIFADLDNFKFVNDNFGHAVGDEVLMTVADRILHVHDASHQTMRFGGDEFVLIVDGPMAAKGSLVDFMEHLRAKITETITIAGMPFNVTCSLGGAVYPDDADGAEALLRNADGAMYDAKTSGRDRIVVRDVQPGNKAGRNRNLMEQMPSAIENQQFFLEYQPQFDLESGKIIGAEALLRWNHPDHGVIPPDGFLRLAEESGLIIPLGAWVLKESCRQNKEWQSGGLPPVRVGVNVSARQMFETGLLSDLRSALDDSGLAPQYLELELAESALVQNTTAASIVFKSVRELGVKLALDRFGSGFSSLSALKETDLTRLKIDQSYIQDLDQNDGARSIARAIVSLGCELGLDVVAEGVETAKQQAFLASCRCKTVQGFHFGRPMTGEKLAKLMSMTLP